MFEVNLPYSPGKNDIIKELIKVKWRLRGRKIEELLDLPEMTDPDKNTVMSLLITIGPSAYLYNREINIRIALEMINISLKYGNSDVTSYAYLAYGGLIVMLNTNNKYSKILALRPGNLKSAYKFGELALRLNERFKVPALRCILNYIFGYFINPWNKHLKNDIEYFERAYKYGMEFGELIYSAYSANNIIGSMLFKGDCLDNVYKTLKKYSSHIKRINEPISALAFVITERLIQNLKGFTKDPLNFDCNNLREDVFIEEIREGKYYGVLFCYYVFKLQLLFLFERYNDAMKLAVEADKILDRVACSTLIHLHHLYYPLTMTALYPGVKGSTQRKYYKELKRILREMKKLADNCPENFLHKFLLIRAEMARIFDRNQEAAKLYDQAIESAQKNDYAQNEAIANELAGRFHLANDEAKIARLYFIEARNGYARWGAAAKVKDMDEKYAHLELNAETINYPVSVVAREKETHALSSILDMTAILKASQAISGEIELDKLMIRLMHAVMENAGAQKGCLIMQRDSRLFVEAKMDINIMEKEKILQSIPVESLAKGSNNRLFSPAIVNYVKNVREDIVLNDAINNTLFKTDPYILRNRPKSIICTPLLRQSRLTGILYLENNLTTYAFTPERIQVLRILSSQAAISLENARYYEEVRRLYEEIMGIEERERQRLGRDLHDSLGQLLTGIALRCEALHKMLDKKGIGEANQAVEIESLVNDAITMTRKLARALSPFEGTAGNLVDAIIELTINLKKDSGVPIVFKQPKQITVDNNTATHIFRIAQEAINNAIKHADAKEINVELSSSSTSIILTVKDDGKGIPDVMIRKEGMGLHNMRYRANIIDASLNVQQSPNGGTILTLSIDKNPLFVK